MANGDSRNPYYDSAQGVRVTRKQAERELRKHGVPAEEQEDYFAQHPGATTFDGQELLRWLGY
jgi:hypothetical protein